jgi:hypothetical protein
MRDKQLPNGCETLQADMTTITEETPTKPSILSKLVRFSRLNSWKDSVKAVVIVGLVGYIIIFFIFYLRTEDLRDFILIGKTFITQSQASSLIKVDPNYNYYDGGYDGQFAYFIAVDPEKARYYSDVSLAMRYSRILYPMTARLLALGRPAWIPLTLILVNWLAIGLGTWAVAAWCRLNKLSVWYALVYAFFIGQAISFSRDLTEPLAYALVAWAVYVLARWQHQVWLAGILFGLAGLSRETSLLFPFLFFFWVFYAYWRQKNILSALFQGFIFGFLAFAPFVAWQIIIFLWLGVANSDNGVLNLPYSGLFQLYPFSAKVIEVIQATIIPATLCVGIVIWSFWRDKASRGRVELWLLLANALLFALMLHPLRLVEIYGSARISIGVTLAAIYALPYTKNKIWFYICSALWLLPLISFLLEPINFILNKIKA